MSGIFSLRWWPLKLEIPWWFVKFLKFNSDCHHIQDYTGKLAICTLAIGMLCWYKMMQFPNILWLWTSAHFYPPCLYKVWKHYTCMYYPWEKHVILIIRKHCHRQAYEISNIDFLTFESEQNKLLFLPLQSLKLVCHF